MTEQPVAPIPRVALTREEAAAALGMSLDSFERHVQPTIRLVRRGRMRLVPGQRARALAGRERRAAPREVAVRWREVGRRALQRARPVAHDDRSAMSKKNRSREPGHHGAPRPRLPQPRRRAAPARRPSRPQVWDAARGKRITRPFPTITAARQWRQDAYVGAARRHADRRPRPDAPGGRRRLARRRARRDRAQPLRGAVQAVRDPRLRAEPRAARAARARARAPARDHPAAAAAVRRPARRRRARAPRRSRPRSRRCARSTAAPASSARCRPTR